MAEAQCLNQSFKFGLAEQQILKPFAMKSGPTLLFRKIKEKRTWSQVTVETNRKYIYYYWVWHAEVALEAKPF